MKCPKCGYLGFETTDRCRHCGYDFSLAVPAENVPELPLRLDAEPEAPLADFDFDRVIGARHPDVYGEFVAADSSPTPDDVALVVATPTLEVPRPLPVQSPEQAAALPLFSGRASLDDLVIAPPPARPPLAVRRSTPEVARRRTPRVVRRETGGLELELGSASAVDQVPAPDAAGVEPMAPKGSVIRRAGAALVDLVLLGSIDAAVLYLTLAIAGLTVGDVLVIPPVPMLAFLLLLNGGYLVAFTTANGQTIGKMLTGVRVVGDSGGRVEVGGAVLRAAGVLLSLATLGLSYVPALISSDGRALHDRLAGTRVVRHA